MIKRTLFLVLPLIAVICALPLVNQLVNNAEEKDAIVENPPQVKCYEAGPVHITEPTVDELKEQLEQLDTLYGDKKIDQATYKIRKVDLLKRIEDYSK